MAIFNATKKVNVELFHRWHRSDLTKRLGILGKINHSDYIIGVDKLLTKDEEIAGLLKESMASGIKAFLFSGLPTAKAVLTHLE